MLCVSSVECMWFNEPEPKKYYDLKKCLMVATNLGNETYNRMTKKGIPVKVKTWCKEMEYHGEYS